MPGSSIRETAGIEVTGLRELVKELKAGPERLDKGLRSHFRTIAKRIEADARAAAQAQHPTRKTAKPARPPIQHWGDLVKTIRAGSDATSPYLQVGDQKVPWVLGYEFGSRVHRQFPAWQGNKGSAGHFFWPAIRKNRALIETEMLAAIDETLAAKGASSA